jgi:hypothetical protein
MAGSIETTSTACAVGIGITLVRVPSHDAHWGEPVLDGGA